MQYKNRRIIFLGAVQLILCTMLCGGNRHTSVVKRWTFLAKLINSMLIIRQKKVTIFILTSLSLSLSLSLFRLPEGESYLCTAVETDADQTLFVTSIEPSNLGMETAHHLMLVGCSSREFGGQNEIEPEKSKNLWNCGGSLGERSLQFAPSCQGGEMQV